jgi:hypothetical protein
MGKVIDKIVYILCMVKFEFLKSTQTESQCPESDLTFDEICPIWSNKLRKGIDEIDRMILVKDSKYCVVGEAWGFSGKQTGYYVAPLIPVIGCWTCIKYGQKFSKAAKHKKSYHDFEPLISEFLRHWNQRHKKVRNTRLNSIVAR